MSASAATPPIEMDSLDAFPPPPPPPQLQLQERSASPNPKQQPNARGPNEPKPPLQSSNPNPNPKYNPAYNSADSTRATTPSQSPSRTPSPPPAKLNGDPKPLPPPPSSTSIDMSITPAAPNGAPAAPHKSQKHDMAIQEMGDRLEMLDRQYLAPDDDHVLMRPQVGRGSTRDSRRHTSPKPKQNPKQKQKQMPKQREEQQLEREDNMDSLGLPVGYRMPPRYDDPAAARRYSSSSSDSRSDSRAGCHGQSHCVLWCAMLTTFCLLPCGVMALAFAVLARVSKVEGKRRMKYQWRCRSFCCSLLALFTLALIIVGAALFYWKAGPELASGMRIAKKHPLSLTKLEKILDMVKDSKIKEHFGKLAKDLQGVVAED